MQKSHSGQIVIPSKAPSVIPIVDPTAEGEASEKTTKVVLKPPLKGSINGKRLCRNVIIHGYCKYEGKGCEFNHDTNKPTSPQTSPENKSKSRNLATLPFQAVSSVSADSVNAPEFVPRFAVDSSTASAPSSKDTSAIDFTALDPSIINQQHSYQSEQPNVSSITNGFSQFGLSNDTNGNNTPHQQQQQQQQQQPSLQQQPQSPSQMLAGLGMVPPTQMDPYYYMNQQAVYPRQPLQHHLYSAPLPHVSNLSPHQRTIQSFFIPDNLREQLTQRNEAQLMTTPARDLGLPMEVHVYHSLYPLDTHGEKSSSFYGHPSSVYKATCSVDGRTYALVRIEGFRLVNELAMQVVEAWRRIRHCNIVSIREAFTTRAFGDSSLIFAYDYHPCSTTIYSTYFTAQGQAALYNSQHQQSNGNPRLIPETTIWSYITQIASALKAVHGSGLAARVIDPKKILITGKNRIRLSGASILDVLQYDGVLNVARQQQEDLLSFGKLIIALACNSLQSFTDIAQSFEYIARYYSPDLKNLILYLLSKPLPTKNIDEIIVMIGPRILHEINCSQFYNDELESELSRELENGRLVRLMAKMGFINERPEFDMDPGWSETGDRYLIKLFRDYVFHQVDENGRPVVDMVHVLTCLNKLDAGVEEKIMLMSRDEQSCLIVSFKEIKNCIVSAFNDLTSGRK
ncbi:PAB-dependent poly(A)-specific ribonuclease subunit 3 [Mucor circinelloides]